MTQKLTQPFVDAQTADGRDRIVFDSQVSGLGLRITPTGTKIFIAQARIAGQQASDHGRVCGGYAPLQGPHGSPTNDRGYAQRRRSYRRAEGAAACGGGSERDPP